MSASPKIIEHKKCQIDETSNNPKHVIEKTRNYVDSFE